MISLIRNVQKTQIYRDRKWISWLPWATGETTYSFEGRREEGGNVQNLDCGDGCATL